MKKISYLILLFISMSVFSCKKDNTTEPIVTFNKVFTSKGAFPDAGKSVIQTADGGYILCGYSNHDVSLIKTNSLGEVEWEKTFGGNGDDAGKFVRQTNDGGFIICGHTRSKGAGKYDVYLVKTNSLGILEWEKTFGSVQDDVGESVKQTADGGYVLCGYTVNPTTAGKAEVYVIKTNASGISQWQKTFGDDKINYLSYDIEQSIDGSYIICGDSGISGYLLKISEMGIRQWDKVFGSANYSVQQTSEGGYIVAGINNYNGTDETGQITKLTSTGLIEWEKTYGGKIKKLALKSIQQTKDGGFIAGGFVQGSTSPEGYILKTDSKGDLQWEYNESYYFYRINSLAQTTDGGYILCGETIGNIGGLNAILEKINADGYR